MGNFDWSAALAAAGAPGVTLTGVRQVRDMADVFGAPQPPLHPLEQQQIDDLRERAENNLAAAERIRARAEGGARDA